METRGNVVMVDRKNDDELERLADGADKVTAVAALKELLRRSHRERHDTAARVMALTRKLWLMLLRSGRRADADALRPQLLALAAKQQELLVTGFFAYGLRHEPE